MSKIITLAAVAVAGLALVALARARQQPRQADPEAPPAWNEAASPRLPKLPELPRLPDVQGFVSGAAPNMPQHLGMVYRPWSRMPAMPDMPAMPTMGGAR
jgi:hypothetical protein